MLLISCPFCGPRAEDEFGFGGDATLVTPKEDDNIEIIADYLFLRNNPKGWHTEYWHHRYGCRRWLKIERHTVTHEIKSVSPAAGQNL